MTMIFSKFFLPQSFIFVFTWFLHKKDTLTITALHSDIWIHSVDCLKPFYFALIIIKK